MKSIVSTKEGGSTSAMNAATSSGSGRAESTLTIHSDSPASAALVSADAWKYSRKT